MSFSVEQAKLDWESEEPRSTDYDDIYFSRGQGLKESEYVFLSANRLPERFDRTVDDNSFFTIAETGFGTGLNFLATLASWDNTPTSRQRLHYVSIEKYPLPKPTLERALGCFPELGKYTEQLITNYPPLIKGIHTLYFSEGQVTLTLLFGDVGTDLANLNFCADAWYLDGFNPANNPDMWTQDLFDLMGKHSRPGTTFSTFTCAGFVRRGLQSAGFHTGKQKGFGKKREMLIGQYLSEHNSLNAVFPGLQKRWSTPEPSSNVKEVRTPDKPYDADAIVIGSGLAGVTTAWNLASRGLKTILVDRASAPVSGASGQSRLIMYTKLPASYSMESRLIVAASSFAQRFYTYLQARHPDILFWHALGVMQIGWNTEVANRQLKTIERLRLPESFLKALSIGEASETAGLPLKNGGLFLPGNGCIDPAQFANACLTNKNITEIFSQEALELQQDPSDYSWVVHTNGKSISARSVVVANSFDALKFKQTCHLPLKTIRGQTSTVLNSPLVKPKTILCGEGYLCPHQGDRIHLGATYDLNNKSLAIVPEDHHEILDALAAWLPEWDPAGVLSNEEYHSKTGLRCTTPDYNPIVGFAPKEEQMVTSFGKLREDASACHDQHGEYYSNLYLNLGHGSKGALTAPISAELIGSLIEGGTAPVAAEQYQMLSPSRFIIRQLIRGRR